MYNLIKYIDVLLKYYYKSIVDNKDVFKYVMMMLFVFSIFKLEVIDVL